MLQELPTTIPIIPILSPADLLPSLQAYIKDLEEPPQLNTSPPIPTLLLSHATTAAPYCPLTAHDTNILSDLFPSLRALDKAVKTKEGKEILADYFEAETARRIIGFWNREMDCN
jgi:hypothetical protein